MLTSLLRRTVFLAVVGAIVAAVREGMLRHHERELDARPRREP